VCHMVEARYTTWYRTIRRDLVRCRVSKWRRCYAATSVPLGEAKRWSVWIVEADADCETCVIPEGINLDA
jgi:hypothetical protein